MTEPIRPKKTFVMVRIPAGEFVMGSGPGHGDTDEYPQHTVFVDEFLIGRYLVTAAEYAGFLNQNGNPDETYIEVSSETTLTRSGGRYHPRQGCAGHPANGVTWFGAKAFCDWLSAKSGRKFRLPTEAEWEKASRGGMENQRYPWGNSAATGQAQHHQVWTNPKHTLSPVGSYPSNPYGLYDMAGNVWEWCADWYDRNYYHVSTDLNPKGPDIGVEKVLRGGSWGGLDVQVRCGIRVGERPQVSDSRVGFRLARTV